jgi:hypothetical protein
MKTLFTKQKQKYQNGYGTVPVSYSVKKAHHTNTNQGFNFLGFTCITITRAALLELKYIILESIPSETTFKSSTIVINNRNASSYNLVNLLRPVIMGWANYFPSADVLQSLVNLHIIFQKLRAWVFRRDTRNGKKRSETKVFS